MIVSYYIQHHSIELGHTYSGFTGSISYTVTSCVSIQVFRNERDNSNILTKYNCNTQDFSFKGVKHTGCNSHEILCNNYHNSHPVIFMRILLAFLYLSFCAVKKGCSEIFRFFLRLSILLDFKNKK